MTNTIETEDETYKRVVLEIDKKYSGNDFATYMNKLLITLVI